MSIFKNAVNEAIQLITEGSRDNRYITPLYEKYKDKLGTSDIKTESQFKQSLQKILEMGGFNALSKEGNYFLGGIARMYLEGQLTKNKEPRIFEAKMPKKARRAGANPVAVPDVRDEFYTVKVRMLNSLIDILRNRYIDSVGKEKMDEDFGGMSADKVIEKYKPDIEKYHRKHKLGRVRNMSKLGYSFDIIHNMDEMRKYKQYTLPYTWCVTYDSGFYRKYTSKNFFVVVHTDDFKEVPQEVTAGYPADKYGTSLMALRLDKETGKFVGGTFRWNHGNFSVQSGSAPQIKNADFAVTPQVLEKVGITQEMLRKVYYKWCEDRKRTPETGESFDKDTLEENIIRAFKAAQIKINNGEDPKKVFPTDGFIGCHMVFNGGKPSKSVYTVRLTSQYGGAETVLDRGKIMYEHYLEDGHAELPQFFLDNGLIWIRNDYSSILYDYHQHKFIELDGNYTFSRSVLNPKSYGKRHPLFNSDCIFMGYTHSNERYCEYDVKKKKFVEYGGKHLFMNRCTPRYESKVYMCLYRLSPSSAVMVDIRDGHEICKVNMKGFETSTSEAQISISDSNSLLYGMPSLVVDKRTSNNIPGMGGANKLVMLFDSDTYQPISIGGRMQFDNAKFVKSAKMESMDKRVFWYLFAVIGKYGAVRDMNKGTDLTLGGKTWINGLRMLDDGKISYISGKHHVLRSLDGDGSVINRQKSDDIRGYMTYGDLVFVYNKGGSVNVYRGNSKQPLVLDGVSQFTNLRKPFASGGHYIEMYPIGKYVGEKKFAVALHSGLIPTFSDGTPWCSAVFNETFELPYDLGDGKERTSSQGELIFKKADNSGEVLFWSWQIPDRVFRTWEEFTSTLSALVAQHVIAYRQAHPEIFQKEKNEQLSMFGQIVNEALETIGHGNI